MNVRVFQLTSFGFSRSSHVNFLEKSNIAFKHLYLKDWNPSFETLPYPPATGTYALYTIPKVYESIDYAMERVSGRGDEHDIFFLSRRNSHIGSRKLDPTKVDRIEKN